MTKTPTAASVRNVDMRVGMNAERKVDTVIRMNMVVVNNNKEVTEVTNSTAAASPDTRVDIMSAERRENMEEEIKMSTADPVVVMKVVMAVVTRTIIAEDGDKRGTVEVVKVKMTMALASNKEVMEGATSSMVVASVDMSAERKVDMEGETKMSTVVPVGIREIMEITRTIIATVANKEDTAAVGIFPREEAMAVVVDTGEATMISAGLLNMLNSTQDILMTTEYIPTS
jgi:hypothetical protein